MNVLKTTLAVLALTLGASAAQAATSDPRGAVVTKRSASIAPQIVATREASDDKRLFGAMSRPTIFGHDVENSRSLGSDEKVKAWGYSISR